MAYRFLIINTDYSVFLHWLYNVKNIGLEDASYNRQIYMRRESLFGVTGFYCDNLRKLGQEACEVYANNEIIQKKWAEEHGIRTFNLMIGNRPRFYNILKRQIEYYKPDVLLNLDMYSINGGFLRRIKPNVRLIIGQHAAFGMPDKGDWRCYDLVISSFPPVVDLFRKKGIKSEYIRLAFEPSILDYLLGCNKREFDISFIGSFHKIHSSRIEFLEQLCAVFDNIKIWGPDISCLSAHSPIRRHYMGHAWGIDMFRILKSSKITINHHGDVPPYANNMRLFEATGTAALLITDNKRNLGEIFHAQKEVVSYGSPKECAQLIKYYLSHDDERKEISAAGQAKTLRDHVYYNRMEQLLDVVHRLI